MHIIAMAKLLVEEKLYAAIGRRVAQARKRTIPKSLSQAELAERVGLTRGSIANIERGYQRPPIETLYRLAQALGTEPHLLLPGPTELDLGTTDGPELTKREQADLKKLGIVGGVTEQWMKRAKTRPLTGNEGEP